MRVEAKAPVRIDFAGGWTDVDLFSRNTPGGGIVVNAAIAHHVVGSLEVRDDFTDTESGLQVQYGFDLPPGSGLGTSAAMNVVWLALVENRLLETAADRSRIADLAFDLEALLGILGGRQDQYSSALGGFQYLHFDSDGVRAERLLISRSTTDALEESSVLVYTGKPRLSGKIHEQVWGAFESGRPATVEALQTIRDTADALVAPLIAGDIPRIAERIAQNWEAQKQLDASVTNPEIDSLFAAARDTGALGGKACGAGGGGCLYFLTPPDARDAVEARLVAMGARAIPVRFDFDGLMVTRE